MKARWLTIAVVVSVALNLFLVCAGAVLVARGGWRGGGAATARAAPQRPALRRAAAALAPANRIGFVRLLRAQGLSVRGDNRAARSLRADAWGSLAAPGAFDPGSAKVALAQARAINQASRGKVEDAVIDFAAALPAAERAHLGVSMRSAVLSQGPVARAGTGQRPTPTGGQ